MSELKQLTKMQKNVNRSSEHNDLQIKKVSYLQEIGIDIKAMYIIGLPSDTEETYLKTLKFSKLIASTYAQFSVFTPYQEHQHLKIIRIKLLQINRRFQSMAIGI